MRKSPFQEERNFFERVCNSIWFGFVENPRQSLRPIVKRLRGAVECDGCSGMGQLMDMPPSSRWLDDIHEDLKLGGGHLYGSAIPMWSDCEKCEGDGIVLKEGAGEISRD